MIYFSERDFKGGNFGIMTDFAAAITQIYKYTFLRLNSK